MQMTERARALNRLFQRMADEYEGVLTVTSVHRGVDLCFLKGDDLVRARMEWVPTPFQNMVRVTQVCGKGEACSSSVLMEPVPSAVIAVATR